MDETKAKGWEGSKILALGGCVSGATLLFGTFGMRAALVGSVVGLILGIFILRRR